MHFVVRYRWCELTSLPTDSHPAHLFSLLPRTKLPFCLDMATFHRAPVPVSLHLQSLSTSPFAITTLFSDVPPARPYPFLTILPPLPCSRSEREGPDQRAPQQFRGLGQQRPVRAGSAQCRGHLPTERLQLGESEVRATPAG